MTSRYSGHHKDRQFPGVGRAFGELQCTICSTGSRATIEFEFYQTCAAEYLILQRHCSLRLLFPPQAPNSCPVLCRNYSSMFLTFSHPPLSLSFHRLTRLSPVLTASTFPLKLQLTRHATASNVSVVDCQSPAVSISCWLFASTEPSNVTYRRQDCCSSRSSPSYPDSRSRCSSCSASSAPMPHPSPNLHAPAAS